MLYVDSATVVVCMLPCPSSPFPPFTTSTVDLPPDLQYTNFFFAYVCKKQPLQLPQHGGLRGQLPNGWVAGSKELFQK